MTKHRAFHAQPDKQSDVSLDLGLLEITATDARAGFTTRHDAMIALGQAGPGAVPVLVRLLHDRHPGIRQAAIRSLGRIADWRPEVLEALEEAAGQDEDPEVRRRAVGELGRAGEPGLPGLRRVRTQTHPDVLVSLAWAFRRVGPSAYTDLTDLYHEHPGWLQGELLQIMTGMTGLPDAALDFFHQAALHGSFRVRHHAVTALAHLGPRAVSRLTDVLRHSRHEIVRATAAGCLIPFGALAAEAVPALTAILREPVQRSKFEVRDAALAALAAIAPQALLDGTFPQGDASWKNSKL